jgi:hypothetical protein
VRRLASIWPLTHEARLVWPQREIGRKAGDLQREPPLEPHGRRKTQPGPRSEALSRSAGASARATSSELARLGRSEVVLTDERLVAVVGEQSPRAGVLGR